MNPLTLLFKLPLMPLRGVITLAELIADEAERELHDPARVRRELEEAESKRAAGQISDEDVSQIEEKATSSLITGQTTAKDDRS
jgi:gas vesicle protein GvpG